MARNKPIRITKNDRAEYAKLVRHAKAKINRVKKTYGIDLSNEVNLPKLENFKTRESFNVFKEQTASFTNRFNLHYQFKKNPYGVVASKAKINEIERNTKQAQRNADREIKRLKKLPFFSGGKEQTPLGAVIQSVKMPSFAGIYRPDDFNFKKVRFQQDLERKRDKAERKANPQYYNRRNEIMRTNYVMKLAEMFNSDADKLIDLIQSMSATDFYDLYQSHDEFNFKYIYEPEQVTDFVDMLTDYTKNYIQEFGNHDLKDF